MRNRLEKPIVAIPEDIMGVFCPEVLVLKTKTIGQLIEEHVRKNAVFTIASSSEIHMLNSVRFVAVVGESGAGKTTLVRAARELALPGVDFPMRYTTRPSRQGEDEEESRSISRDEFVSLVGQGVISLHWRKPVGNGHEIYGFGNTDASLTVFSGGPSLWKQRKTILPTETLWIEVFAPDEVRAVRLSLRSPDISGEDRSLRLAAHPTFSPDVDLVIHNDQQREKASEAFCSLLHFVSSVIRI